MLCRVSDSDDVITSRGGKFCDWLAGFAVQLAVHNVGASEGFYWLASVHSFGDMCDVEQPI